MAQAPGRTGDGGVDGTAVGGLLGDVDVADALAGEAQGLGVGVADDGVVIQLGQEGLSCK